MKLIRNVFLLVVLLGGGLFFTNPVPDDFSTFISDYVQEELNAKSQGSALSKSLHQGLSQIAGEIGGQFADRKNFQVASIYTIDVLGARYVFLGIGGKFLPLEVPEKDE